MLTTLQCKLAHWIQNTVFGAECEHDQNESGVSRCFILINDQYTVNKLDSLLLTVLAHKLHDMA